MLEARGQLYVRIRVFLSNQKVERTGPGSFARSSIYPIIRSMKHDGVAHFQLNSRVRRSTRIYA